ncbi:MAG: hypothetical protein JWL96_3607 [Sphingomonas bacterium]|uniref:hypothetical protein n=1 Tax=Sphingomonas bacterium TaxID=1895847 RepID=UPI002632C8AC|nr:hypothetical protein [Sphingomonas bacterium]MDB5711537.1 hypothetical protein [Sphingomonas bacterium]
MTQNWNPWWPWGQPNANEPLSGDVSQWFRIFSPSITVEGRGDPDLEGRIVRDVATYGAQLGQISAIVLALADGEQAPAEEVAKLRAIVADIEKVKESYKQGALDRARAAMLALSKDDPAGYAELLGSLKSAR